MADKAIEYRVTVYSDCTEWRNLADKLHRLDGPAIEYTHGDKYWFLNDKHYRVDGPAIEYADGYKAWYINGKRHRVDGPAIEFPNNAKFWYMNGKRFTEEEFIKATTKQVDCIDGKIVEIDGKQYKITAVK
jgi:hypothetical protein